MLARRGNLAAAKSCLLFVYSRTVNTLNKTNGGPGPNARHAFTKFARWRHTLSVQLAKRSLFTVSSFGRSSRTGLRPKGANEEENAASRILAMQAFIIAYNKSGCLARLAFYGDHDVMQATSIFSATVASTKHPIKVQ